MVAVTAQAREVEVPDTGVWERRWTRDEYYRMGELGILGLEERVQLIEGEIFVMAPQHSPHATGVRLAEDALRLAFLVVEVSDTTVRFDRERKGSLYARARIPEYWLLNLRRRCLEVYRAPVPAPDAPYGARYHSRRVLHDGEKVSPLAAPNAQLAVADLLPRRRNV